VVPADAPVVRCYEAGRDGFWVHRALTAVDVENIVVDPASIQQNRRTRRAVRSARRRRARHGERGARAAQRVVDPPRHHAPAHPARLPAAERRHERMHNALKAEACRPPRGSLGAPQRTFNTFRHLDNEERPDSALGGHQPPNEYVASAARPAW
jgi:hypothetical protein